MSKRKLIDEYLSQAKMLQVATTINEQPWACTVYFAFDEKLNLYWISKPDRRHSKEIKKNDKVAGTIVLPHTPGDAVRGIQFQGIARELNTKQETVTGMKYYAKRYGLKQERVKSVIERTDGHVCYKITPSLYVLFDEVNFPESPRQEFTVAI